MREDEERDRAFERFVHQEFGCAAQGRRPCPQYSPLEFAHLKHAGMGGKIVPSYGNGICLCRWHHQGYCESFHRVGLEHFGLIEDLDLWEIAAYMARAFDGDFLQLAEEPPKGVYRRAA